MSYLHQLGLKPCGEYDFSNLHLTWSPSSLVYSDIVPDGLPMLSTSEMEDPSPFVYSYLPNTSGSCSYTTTTTSLSSEPATQELRATQPQYRCRHCTAVFRTSTNRLRHEKSVHGVSVSCQYCHKKIKMRADYKSKHAKTCRARPRVSF